MPYQIGEHVQAAEACNLCHATTRRIAALEGRKGQPLTTAICTHCGLVQSEPIPSPEELREYYRDRYRREYKRTYQPKRKHILRYSRNAIPRLERILRANPGRRLLDVGSGSGEFVYMASKAGFDATGLEPHEVYSAYARDTFGVPIITASFQEAPIAAQSVDVITLHHVLEHLADPFAAICTLHGWLKHGGLLVVDVPDIDRVPRRFTSHFHYAHIYNFSHATLRAMLERGGFTVESGEGTALLARRTGEPSLHPAKAMPEYYHALWGKLSANEGIALRKKRSVVRLWQRCGRYTWEYAQALCMGHPKDIADNVWKRHRGRMSLGDIADRYDLEGAAAGGRV